MQVTYARARLFLGITTVGTMGTLCAVALFLRLPQQFFSISPINIAETAKGLAIIVGLYAAIALPFDFIGGYVLERVFNRDVPHLGNFAYRLVRGITGQGAVYICCGLSLIEMHTRFGNIGVIMLFAVLQLILIAFQLPLAMFVGGLRRTQSGLAGQGPYGTGGITGILGSEAVVLPMHWKAVLSSDQLNVMESRRRYAIASGLRRNGLMLALAWNVGGFAISVSLAGGTGSVASLLTTALYFSLTSFVGLLVLPKPSQTAVLQTDAGIINNGNRDALVASIRALAGIQDGEDRRHSAVQLIFHPIPSVSLRTENTLQNTNQLAAWNAARLAIFLSWAGLSFVSRAVHCNVGRPDVWVLLPCD
jgi:hypothetical protein